MELQAADDDNIPEYIDASSKCLCCQGFVYECEGEICSRLGVCDCFADKEYAGDESTSPIATFTNSTVNPEESLMLEAFQASIAALLVPGFVSSGTGNDQLSLLAAMQQQVHYHQQQQQQSGGFFVGHRGGYRGSRGGFGRGVRGVVNNRGGRRGEYNSYQQPIEQNQRVSNSEDPWVTGASQKYTHIHRSGEPLQEIWPGITEQTPLSLSSSTTIQQRGLSNELATHGEQSEKVFLSHGISSSRTKKMADSEQISAPKTASEILASKVSGGVDESKVLVQRGPIGAVFLEDKDKIIEKKTSRRRNKNKVGEVGLETSTSLIVNNDNLEMERKRIPTALVEEGGSDNKETVKSVLNSLVNLSVSSSVSLPVIELNEEQRLKKDLRNAEKRLRSALDLQSSTSTLDVAQKEKVLQIPEIELIVKDLKGKLLALEVYDPSLKL